jgi:hypothetical protein
MYMISVSYFDYNIHICRVIWDNLGRLEGFQADEVTLRDSKRMVVSSPLPNGVKRVDHNGLLVSAAIPLPI